jgi:hypothetical protein
MEVLKREVDTCVGLLNPIRLAKVLYKSRVNALYGTLSIKQECKVVSMETTVLQFGADGKSGNNSALWLAKFIDTFSALQQRKR